MSDNIIDVANDLTVSQRVLLGMKREAELRRKRLLNGAMKKEWMAAARTSFCQSTRQPCAICGMYSGLTHAHHLAPLAHQFDLGVRVAVHEVEWLCPTHHALVHVFLSAHIHGNRASLDGVPIHEQDKCEELARRGSAILVNAAIAARGT